MRDEGYRCHVSRVTFYVSRLALAALLVVVTTTLASVSAQSVIVIEDRGATLEFPERLTFEAHVESRAGIERVTLEYGVEKLTCGTVMAKVFPDFEPGVSIDVAWTWEMLQSGSQPPGATIWYRWRASDAAGNESVSDEQRVIWLDDQHDWQSISRGLLTLHWYDSSRRFAEDLLDSAADSLAQLGETTGVVPQSPIDLYIYADTADMQEAVLYEPGWTGGQAFPDHDILIIGVSPDLIEWGKSTEAHELTHILVGHLTFSCLGDVPTWLNEGIAVYGEGGPDPASLRRLQDAVDDDRLISVRALSGGFSEHPNKAGLSYTQSYSLVDFLVAEYGPDELLALFGNLRDSMAIDAALNEVYGFGLDGLEDRWRESIGAPPRRAEGSPPTPTAIPTPVPTYRPVAGVPFATPLNVAALPAPTLAPSAQDDPLTPGSPGPAATGAASVAASSEPLQTDLLIVLLIVALAIGIGLIYTSLRGQKVGR